MYTVRIGREHTYTVMTVSEAFELAIDYFRHGAECDVVSEATGEVVMMLRDYDLPHVSKDIRYTL